MKTNITLTTMDLEVALGMVFNVNELNGGFTFTDANFDDLSIANYNLKGDDLIIHFGDLGGKVLSIADLTSLATKEKTLRGMGVLKGEMIVAYSTWRNNAPTKANGVTTPRWMSPSNTWRFRNRNK